MLNQQELSLLTNAAKNKKGLKNTIERYLILKKMSDEPAPNTEDFRKQFSNFYRLNAARPSPEWRAAYFRLLFKYKHKMPAEPHRIALSKLRKYRIGFGETLQFSFVSKLVAFNDECQPLFDRYVGAYFGLGPPSLQASADFRISGFVQNLNEIRKRYEAWLKDEAFKKIIKNVRLDVPGLNECHPIRICDFLVWTAGEKYR